MNLPDQAIFVFTTSHFLVLQRHSVGESLRTRSNDRINLEANLCAYMQLPSSLAVIQSSRSPTHLGFSHKVSQWLPATSPLLHDPTKSDSSVCFVFSLHSLCSQTLLHTSYSNYR